MQPRAEPVFPLRIRAAVPADLAHFSHIDDDAATRFREVGIVFTGAGIAVMEQAEHTRWLRAIESGLAALALDREGQPIAFAVLGYLDGAPYLDQLSVMRKWMGRGIGRTLLERAIAWGESGGELWLTTYAHVPWNGPMYTRYGFASVQESRCGPEMREILREQRELLPRPDQRIAMVRRYR